jgi:hypothetical protein
VKVVYLALAAVTSASKVADFLVVALPIAKDNSTNSIDPIDSPDEDDPDLSPELDDFFILNNLTILLLVSLAINFSSAVSNPPEEAALFLI